MITSFKKFITDNDLFSKKDKILITVSGGMDSRLMVELFSKTGFQFGIAHCNFQLRGNEANRDEQFVKDLAFKVNSPFYSIRFDTLKYARENKVSIQMAARNLRYQWFEKTREQNHYDYIALAHNKDDLEETFFINLTRGTGIRGLSGIKVKNEKLVRPLLFASRAIIQQYLEKHGLSYVEDSSNAEIKYVRNRIRHKIIPEFEKFQPDFRKNLDKTISYLSETDKLLQLVIQKKHQELVKEKDDNVYIDKIKLRELKFNNVYLFEFLRPYGFPSPIIQDILASLSSTSGKQFFSENYRLVTDRDYLIITKKRKNEPVYYIIDNQETHLELPIRIRLKKFENNPDYKPPVTNSIASIDADKIKFPLILRKWQKGDSFIPFGMKHSKKLSDFFIDLKLSLPEKENVWLLTSENKILWVIAYRTDDRYKITNQTKNILQLELMDDSPHNTVF
ncbi:MAG: tRNA lysidine(34) synthetase TilS [Bacteroidales bacterium]|nr:tRNA lysidine(34) synthetase TilS [Bacteroidales bacterium]